MTLSRLKVTGQWIDKSVYKKLKENGNSQHVKVTTTPPNNRKHAKATNGSSTLRAIPTSGDW